MLTLPAVHAAPAMAVLPSNQLPVGIGWLPPFVDPVAARLAWAGVVVGAVVGGLGVSRWGFAAVTLCGAYLLAIPQLRGGVQHDHHLLWFSALLAVSPCEDALSVRHPRPVPGRSLGWGLPVRVAWLLVALVFFFPGVHKLRVQGLAWAGESLRWLLLWKWAQAWDFVPLFRLDQHPALLRAGGLAVLAFEVGFPLAILWAPSRRVWVLGALGFHAATALLFDIDFRVLWPCYVVFLPLDPPGPVVERPWRATGGVAGVLLGGVVAAGLAGETQAWPFACYPTFDRPVGRWMPTLAEVAVGRDGALRDVDERLLASPASSQAFYGEAWGLAGLYGVDDPAARDAFWQRVRGRPGVREAVGDAVEIRLYRAELDVQDGVVRRGTLLHRTAP